MTQNLQYVGTALFAIAILHTFFANKFLQKAHHYPKGSMQENLFHLLGEIEIVFGFWAGIFLGIMAVTSGSGATIEFVESLDFTEPAFVFVIMAVSATRSIRALAARGIEITSIALNRSLPFISANQAFYCVTLILGPLLGSFITEPAAMTVIALILRDRYFAHAPSEKFKYKTLALLFVNVSIGGVLTHFAAPPVVMVAKVWNWDAGFMFTHFGWKAIIAVIANVLLTMIFLREDFKRMGSAVPKLAESESRSRTPIWITLIHIFFLFAVVYTAHHMTVFIGLFLLFIGVMQVTEPHQDPLQTKSSMLVAYFLAGLVVLGKAQAWWLSPILVSLGELPLFLGAAGLTAITDNAALTYLGAQVEGLSDGLKYALVAGAVTGGGLTIIANAPNPAGYGVLKNSFGDKGVEPLRLFVSALVPTTIAAICFWFFG